MAICLDPRMKTYQRSRHAICRLYLGSIRQVVGQLFNTLLLMLAVCIATSGGVQAAEQMPEGMKGWWYYIGYQKSGFARTPHEACRLSAANHWGTPLKAVVPSEVPKPIFYCYYQTIIGESVFSYSLTSLFCEDGYHATSPGVCVKWPEPPHPPSCSPGQPGVTVANPVAVATGAKIQSEIDLAGAPDGTMRIVRTYRSLRAGGVGQSAGQGWSFSFDRNFALVFSLTNPQNRTPQGATGSFGDGSSFDFYRQSSGNYVSRSDKRETLSSLSPAFDDWALTRRDGGIERFKKINGQFLLVSSHSRDGVVQRYSYGPDNKLATIADTRGRTLRVTWIGDTVASITGPTISVRYGYELAKASEGSELAGTERLATVDYHNADGAPYATRRFHYEDPNYHHLLTGITDENDVRFATYAYNAAGQAVLSEHACGVNRYTFAYPAKEKRIITDPLGTQRQVEVTYRPPGGLVSSVSQPAGSGCGPGSSNLTYDSSGRLSSSTDFNDKKTCFITDPARGLITSEVTGLGVTAACPTSSSDPIAASSRRITRKWHPDIALETAVASAKQIIRYVYNGQPDANGVVAACASNGMLPNSKPIVVLCSKTVQATRDLNGASGFAAQPDGRSRTWRYSYNASGQLLKGTGPADALGQSESFTKVYYADTTATSHKGDLASTQNAVGEVTKFLAYTKNGLPSKILRADGVTVSLGYGPMQRLDFSTLTGSKGGAETTRYSYDRAGQLTAIVSPDGSTVTLDYDDAHRLTSLRDGTGNRIQLTLDDMGNVTRQEHRDAAGAVVYVSNLAFDALNRLASFKRGTQIATTYQYDRAGNLTALKDALGRVTTADFDNLDRMTKTTSPAAMIGKPTTVIGYSYDHQDSLVSVTDPRKLTTRYTNDGYGQLTGLSSPDTATSQFQFDDAGNMVFARDGRGITTALRYDSARRVTKSGTSTFEYGKTGSSAAGRLTSMTDESGNSNFVYDGYGRLEALVQTVGTGVIAKRFPIGYKYGSSGRGTGHVTSMTYPSGNRIDISYGPNGQATGLSLITPSATTPTIILSNIQYTALGAIESWNWGAPVRNNFYKREFDSNGRLKSYPLGAPGLNGTTRTVIYDCSQWHAQCVPSQSELYLRQS